uniref:rRNA-processing protein EBP2 isogeny n=1 Tax=Cajanus cajan TaxID=3821 RepID=A0A151U520_CAJCA|nr:putative rRNA-processing protein EBP2 isogeny [Cajanus cajan]
MSSSESEQEEDVRLTEPSKNAVYNRDALLDKLGDISWPENVDWIHKLSVDIDQEQEVDKWRKQRQQSGFADNGNDADMDFNFEDGKVFERSNKKRPGVSPWDRSGGKAKQAFGKGKKQKKRDGRDSKFGFGGKKGMKKQNTADTTNDFSKFNKGAAAGNKKRKR